MRTEVKEVDSKHHTSLNWTSPSSPSSDRQL